MKLQSLPLSAIKEKNILSKIIIGTFILLPWTLLTTGLKETSIIIRKVAIKFQEQEISNISCSNTFGFEYPRGNRTEEFLITE